MGSLLQNLVSDAWKAPGAGDDERFQPVARFYPNMDFLLYVSEDCSYRADRVDMFLTLLWHPYDERVVGIKLKGFRFIFDRVKATLGLEDAQFLPLVQALEVALTGGMAEAIIRHEAQDRVVSRYNQARKIAQGVNFSVSEIEEAA